MPSGPVAQSPTRSGQHLLHRLAQAGPEQAGVGAQHGLGKGGCVVLEAHRLDVELVGDQAGEGLQGVGACTGNDQLGQRQAGAQAPVLTLGEHGGGDRPHPVHGVDQLGVGRQLVRFRPIGQMHGPLPGQAGEHLFGHHGQ